MGLMMAVNSCIGDILSSAVKIAHCLTKTPIVAGQWDPFHLLSSGKT